jgi:hypothetical protein
MMQVVHVKSINCHGESNMQQGKRLFSSQIGFKEETRKVLRLEHGFFYGDETELFRK